MVKIGPTKTYFWGYFESFFTYAPRFSQMKELIKIHICGKFHHYSICGCKTKKFQSFSYQSSIHKMAPFWWFLGPYFPKYCSVLLKFWLEVISNKINTVFEKSFKILHFGLNGTQPKFTVIVYFGALFTGGKPKILLKA